MTSQLPPSLQRFGAAFDAAAHHELTPTVVHAGAARPAHALRRRPRVLAGGTLGLAGVAAALVVALSAGGAAAPPAYAIANQSDGSVSVTLNPGSGLTDGIVGANRQLAEMNLHEGISIKMATGAAAAPGPVTCTADATVSQPVTPISASVSSSVTIPQGDGADVYHLASCTIHNSDLTTSQIGTTTQSGKYLLINAG